MSAVLSALTVASAAGINAYATLLVLGLCVRYDVVPLEGRTAEFFAQPWVLVSLAVLYLVEFVADKIPAVDHAWDAVHTVIRPVAGALAAVAVVGGHDGGWVVLAAIMGGMTSLLFHGAKATGRVAVTATTGGAGNWLVSLVEDVLAFAGSLLGLLAPLLAVFVLLAGGTWLVVRMRRKRSRACSA